MGGVVHQLPKLSEREYTFCTILRDADKADILRVNCETPRTEIYDLPEEEFKNSFITDEIYQSLLSGSNVDLTYSKTGIDFILGHIAFVYGLVWPESLQIVKEQGYLQQLISFQSSNPDTRKKMEVIRAKILDFLDHPSENAGKI